MNRLQSLIILTIFFVVSCNTSENELENIEKQTEVETTFTNEEKVNLALTFINSYVENSNKMNEGLALLDWVNSQTIVSSSFKTEVKKIIDEAMKEDPEMGLDADPIFDAQDYPSEGFELDTFDDKTNTVLVKGKDASDFKLLILLIDKNGAILINGCGIVNVPVEQRVKR